MPIRATGRPRAAAAVLACLGAVLVLTACGGGDQGTNTDPRQVDTTQAPETGACRVLTPEDLAHDSNATRTIDCAKEHTAETYLVGQFPPTFGKAAYDATEVAAFGADACRQAFMTFLETDESLAMRTIVGWALFRPSEKAWKEGARWYRCDVAGGTAQSKTLVTLPTSARALLKGRPGDQWLACGTGDSVATGKKVACSRPHTWRAVTTIKLGQPDDPYPGDDVVEARTQDFCSDSVAAWLGYPVDFDFGYTWFHAAEWAAGNRRSVCWAKTNQ